MKTTITASNAGRLRFEGRTFELVSYEDNQAPGLRNPDQQPAS
jgi:hypothetical protein